jgi:hypothetical protein
MNILIETWRMPDSSKVIVNVRYTVDSYELLQRGVMAGRGIDRMKASFLSVFKQMHDGAWKFIRNLVLSSEFDKERTTHVMQKPMLEGSNPLCIEAEIVE